VSRPYPEGLGGAAREGAGEEIAEREIDLGWEQRLLWGDGVEARQRRHNGGELSTGPPLTPVRRLDVVEAR